MVATAIIKVVKESLALEDSIKVTAETTLSELGADRADALDILYKCGAFNTQYLTDGQINARGRDLLRLAGRNSDYEKHLNELSRKETSQIMSELKIAEIELIADNII